MASPVIVENKAGASGNIGAEMVALARPDGHTLLSSPPPPFVINRSLFAHLSFDPAKFVPITVLAGAPNVLVAQPGLGVGNATELIALAKKEPGNRHHKRDDAPTSPGVQCLQHRGVPRRGYGRRPGRVLCLSRQPRPGGRIAVTEGDLGSHAIDASDRATTRSVLSALSEGPRHGCIGRSQRTMFVDAGLRDISVGLVPILTTSYAEWSARLGVEPFVATLVANGSIARDAVLAWIDDLRRRDAQGRFSGTALLYSVAGTVATPPSAPGSRG